MTKKELIAEIAEKTGMSKKNAADATNAFIDTVTEALRKNEKVQLPGFATFETIEKPAGMRFNPAKKEKTFREAKRVAKCRISKSVIEKEN